MKRSFGLAFCLFACGRSGLGVPEGEGGNGGPFPFCGDGVIDAGEGCDDANSNDNDACTNECVLATCNNGVLDPAEACEGTDLGGQTCEGLGFGPGDLACDEKCLFDTSGCDPCGDGVINAGEQCDGADVGGASCESLGFAGGSLSCTGNCFLNLVACIGCGNGVIDVGEQCDLRNLNGQSCQSLGFSDGELACSGQCTLDPSDCSVCGNGNIEGSEECDDGNVQPGDGCSATCQLPACGDGTVDPGEQCDEGPLNEDRWALAYGLGLPATPDVPLAPFDNPESAVSFYDFFSASAHTGFEALETSRVYFYRNTANAILSLVFHHGIDQDTSGLSQPSGAVDWVFLGVPSGAFIAQADDNFSELFPVGFDSVEGHWTFQNNSDGGLIAQWPFPGDWETQLEVSFTQGISTFEIMDGDTSFTNLTGEDFVTFFARSTPADCRTNCTVPTCGDGLFDAGEVCDDGNVVGGDGCSADCSALQ